MKIIDVNAGIGFWPIQRFSSSTLEELDRVFEKAGIGEGWLSAVESILYPEPDTWDVHLFERLGAFPRFRPVKTVNPVLANWQKSWDAIATRFPLAAIKLFPNYHDYSLNHVRADALCRKATIANLPVLISMRVNDERNQPHFLQVAGTSAEEVAALSHRNPETRLVALCAYGSELSTLANGSSNLLVDISFLDGADTLAQVAGFFPHDRLVFGSHEAFLHVQAARLKIDRSTLPAEMVQKIAFGNVTRKIKY